MRVGGGKYKSSDPSVRETDNKRLPYIKLCDKAIEIICHILIVELFWTGRQTVTPAVRGIDVEILSKGVTEGVKYMMILTVSMKQDQRGGILLSGNVLIIDHLGAKYVNHT